MNFNMEAVGELMAVKGNLARKIAGGGLLEERDTRLSRGCGTQNPSVLHMYSNNNNVLLTLSLEFQRGVAHIIIGEILSLVPKDECADTILLCR